jgi:aminoglycoside phosphotransferase (APT) family kinase protein
MTGVQSLDLSPMPWLAGLDPMLAVLPEALPQPADGDTASLHDARWTPGQRCRLSYRVQRCDRTTTFVAVEVTPSGWRRFDFRDDTGLPGIASAADPVLVAARLGPVLATMLGPTPGPTLSPPLGDGVRGCRVEPVRYRPGSRCVLRYDVEAGHHRVRLYAKVLRPDRFDRASLAGILLGDAQESHGAVPRVVAVWPEHHVMVMRAVEGPTVSQVLVDDGVPAGERERIAFRLGGLLARLHAQTWVTEARWSPADEVHGLARSLAPLEVVDASLMHRVQGLLDELGASISPVTGPLVLAHAAFRPGQVRVTGDGAVVALDTDRVSRCGPGRDLGTALAHLTWNGLREPAHRPVLEAAARALLCGYQCHAGPVDRQALRWWHAAALLQVSVRRYRRLEGMAWPLVPSVVEAAGHVLAGLRTGRRRVGRPDLLLDTRHASRLLREAVVPAPPGAPDALRVESAEPLPSAAGRRSVVRYSVRGLDGGDLVSVIGKRFSEPRRARLLYDHLCLLHFGPFHDGDLRVPQPMGVLPEQRLVLYRGCDGVALDRADDPAMRARGVLDAARWLARLHSCDVRLPRRLNLTDEAVTCARWARTIAQAYPHLAAQADQVSRRWLAVVGSAAGPDAPIHKDFHPGHVLVGQGVCVVDLDEARSGHPAFDVAHFCAYLGLLGRQERRGRSSADAFVAAYAEAGGWVDNRAYTGFFAYACLKIARQFAVGSGPCRNATAAQRLAGAERALAEAERCLGE